MKAMCSREDLARGLAVVSRAVAPRTTLPILSNIHVETEGSRLRLSATNLEIGIRCWVDADVAVEGATTVPARVLGEFVNSLLTPQLSLELHQPSETLTIVSDRYRAEIKGIDASDFPILPTIEHGQHFLLDGDTLREMIAQVTFSAATDDSRPALMGVLTTLDPEQGRLTMVSADGFRLSVRRAPLEVSLPEKLAVNIPARALLELSRIATVEGESVAITITESLNQILFSVKSVELVSQLIDGAFPDYDRVIPQGFETRVVASTRSLLNAVRLATPFAREAGNVVRLEVVPEEGAQPASLLVTAQSAEVGAGRMEVDASVTGPAVQGAFNAKYLLDVLNAVGSDQVALEFKSATQPCVFRPVRDVDYVHVVMPIHLGQ